MPTRVIRDGVLDSGRYHSVDKPARLAFLELLLCVDDYGLVPLSDVYLKRHTTAFEAVPRGAADGILQALADTDLLRIYEVEGARFGYIPRFGNHPRAKKPKWPIPPDALGGKQIKDLVRKRCSNCTQMRANAPETETETETETLESNSSSRGASPVVAPAPPAPKAEKKPVEKKPGKPAPTRRAPSTFLIDGPLQRWAREDCPLVDIKAETATFRDHEFAKAKSDWPATWKNWMRREQKRLAEQARPAGKSFRAQDAAAAATEVSRWTRGLLDDRGPSDTVIDMEPTHGRLTSPD